MNGISILMFALGIGVFLAGLWLFTGHKSELLLWKNPQAKKMPMAEVKNVGKWTMIASAVPVVIAIIRGNFFMAGPTRLERATSSVTGRRSNQLSYEPGWI